MKKYWIAVPLVAALLMAGCGQKSTWTKTMATPMPADAYRTQAVSKKLDTFSIINNVCSYLNDDHTWSVYVYSAHVEEEAVFEETEDGFEHTGQYVRETLPDTWSAEGAMTVSGNGQYIRITPAGSVSSAGKAGKEIDAFGRERACVVYPDAFGPGIDYVCTPTAYGLNTEIILAEAGGQNHVRHPGAASRSRSGYPIARLHRLPSGQGHERCAVHTLHTGGCGQTGQLVL